MKPLSLLVLLAVVIFACDYQTEKTIVTTVRQPSLDEFSIDLNSYPDDPIELTGVTTFTYSFEAGGRPAISSAITVDDQTTSVTLINNNSFRVDPALLSTGDHTLSIVVVTPSETGSLADRAGVEVVTLLLERTLVVDHTVPTDPGAIAITSVENREGTIFVTWKPYTKFNFEKYDLVRFDYNNQGIPIEGYTAQSGLTDQDQTTVNDPGYLFGKSEYVIRVTADGQTVSSSPFVYEHPIKPTFEASIDLEGNFKAKWTGVKTLENNVSQYKLQYYGYTAPAFIDIFDKTDTTYEANFSGFRFGDAESIRFTLIGAGQSKEFVWDNITVGEPFAFYSTGYPIQYDITTDAYYGVRYNTNGNSVNRVIRWNNSGVVALDSTDGGYDRLTFPPSAPFAIGLKLDRATKIDLVTLAENEMTSIPAVQVVYAVSDNPRLIAYSSFALGTEIFAETGEVLRPQGFEFESIAISAGGLYAALQGTIYKFNGTAYELWTSYPPYQCQSVNFLDDEKTVILSYPDRIVKFDAETKTDIQSTTSYFGRCNVDPVSGKLGCSSTNMYFVLNQDLTLYKSLPIRFNGSINLFMLLNNAIVCPKYQVKLSDIP